MDYKKGPAGRSKSARLFWSMISLPLIWSVLLPMMLFDLWVEMYHQVCFRLYGIPLVDRKKYIIVWDRAKLSKLSFPEKLGCMYCGYANGLMPYCTEIAARTEKYWCGVKHQYEDYHFVQEHQKTFAEFKEYE
jgi:hypothetical protein